MPKCELSLTPCSNSHKTHQVCSYETPSCWARLEDGWFINLHPMWTQCEPNPKRYYCDWMIWGNINETIKVTLTLRRSIRTAKEKWTLTPVWYHIARQLMLTIEFQCLTVTLVVRASARRKQAFPVPSALIPVTLSPATGPWWGLQANPELNFASPGSLDWVAHRSRPLWSSRDPARKPGRHPPNRFVALSEVPLGLHQEDWPAV